MRKLLLLLMLPLLLIGCGKDGQPGETYLRFTWTYAQPHTFATNNSSIPALFYYGTDYHSNAGTYSLYYETFYGVNYWWSVNYTLTYRLGEPGGLFKDGADGQDSYFTINCAPNGPFFQQTKSSTDVKPTVYEGYDVTKYSQDTIVIERPGIKVEYIRLTEEEFNEAVSNLN